MSANELNYYDIGKRIRDARDKIGLRQADLAAMTELTTAHISHIETGNTRLALPTIVKIANALSVSVDELLCDNLEEVKPIYDKKIADALSDCDAAELKAFLEIICSTKKVIRKTRKTSEY